MKEVVRTNMDRVRDLREGFIPRLYLGLTYGGAVEKIKVLSVHSTNMSLRGKEK